MRPPSIGHARTHLLSIMLATLTMLSLVTGAAAQVTSEAMPLTPEQEAAIRDEMAALYGVLLQGGKSPQDAKLAVNAVGICFGAAYAHGLTRTQTNAVCGEILDAYTIQPGTILYRLTAEDEAWITSRTTAWTSELAGLLEPEQLAAVRTTMQACLEGNLRAGADRTGAVKRCARGLLPLLNEPELQQLVIDAASR
jgi:hypothetical protein